MNQQQIKQFYALLGDFKQHCESEKNRAIPFLCQSNEDAEEMFCRFITMQDQAGVLMLQMNTEFGDKLTEPDMNTMAELKNKLGALSVNSYLDWCNDNCFYAHLGSTLVLYKSYLAGDLKKEAEKA